METNEDVSKAPSIIPDFYFDLIARIVPGSTFLVGVGVLAGWKADSPIQWSGLLVLCYVFGFSLDVIADMFFASIINVLSRLRVFRERFNGSYLTPRDIWEFLHHRSTIQEITLRKVMAERSMFKNLAFGALIFSPVVWALHKLPIEQTHWQVSLSLSVVFALAFCRIHWRASYICETRRLAIASSTPRNEASSS